MYSARGVVAASLRAESKRDAEKEKKAKAGAESGGKGKRRRRSGKSPKWYLTHGKRTVRHDTTFEGKLGSIKSVGATAARCHFSKVTMEADMPGFCGIASDFAEAKLPNSNFGPVLTKEALQRQRASEKAEKKGRQGKKKVQARPITAEDIARCSQFGRAHFEGADLENVSFWYADLTSADFSKAEMDSANLDDVKAQWTIFTNADLSDAKMRHADCTHAQFTGATLSGADLSGANLVTAHFDEVVIDEALTLDGTRLSARGRKELVAAANEHDVRLDFSKAIIEKQPRPVPEPSPSEGSSRARRSRKPKGARSGGCASCRTSAPRRKRRAHR